MKPKRSYAARPAMPQHGDPLWSAMPPVEIAAFYKFSALPDFAEYRAPLRAAADKAQVRGTILLAAEGINGTIAGPPSGVADVLSALLALPGMAGLASKSSFAEEMPFKRMKVRLKKEIVTLGVPGVDPLQRVGTYVAPEEWNALISDLAVTVIDTRNDFEVAQGSFEGAINPHTERFGQFPDFVARRLGEKKDQPIAMFCTGGIRCEKATSYLLAQGFTRVYHLDGGILNYLARVPASQSLWRGDCVVFDERGAVDHALRPASISPSSPALAPRNSSS
ncbi:rhodanese-related sulfurtransferase [Aestuariivirga sp.]|uniref:oxygen-dependent tRNA uridine(34) hydroxylase TrhO n=1 Tax=Aestuariivirga sp. TaxID=2650926 RepID=UPI0039E6A932